MNRIIIFAKTVGVTAIIAYGMLGGSYLKDSFVTKAQAQEELENVNPSLMNLTKLEAILQQEADNIRFGNGQWQFVIDGVPMALLTSDEMDRMRIVSPIIESVQLTTEQRQKMLEANFHSALDGRYAISNGVVYATFIHPLSSLHSDDFRSALGQVSQLVKTFGTTYSSGRLSFGVQPNVGESNLEI